MNEVKKYHNPYSDEEQMSYLREYLLSDENKLQFATRTGVSRTLLRKWLRKYEMKDKEMDSSKKRSTRDENDELASLREELARLRAENRNLQRALKEESWRHEACETLIDLAESTYHIKVRKNSGAK